MLRIERDQLHEAIRTCLPAVARHPHLGILSGLRLHRDDRGLVCSASDLDLSIDYVLPVPRSARVPEIVVPARLLGAVVAEAEGPIEMGVKGARGSSVLHVETSTVSARLSELTGDWPRITPADAEPVALSADDLRSIGRILHAAGTAPNHRPVLTAVCLSDGRAIACDSYRLAMVPLPGEHDTLIPAAMLRAIVAAAGDADCTLAADARAVTITAPGRRWSARTITGVAPDYASLIPTQTQCTLTIDTAGLLDALGEVAMFADRGLSPRVTIAYDDAVLVHAGSGAGDISRMVQGEGDLDFPVVFESRLLVDLAKHVEADELTLELIDATKPVVCRDGALTQVLMPVRP